MPLRQTILGSIFLWPEYRCCGPEKDKALSQFGGQTWVEVRFFPTFLMALKS